MAAAALPITVVLPTFNSLAFVRPQIDSILAQTYAPLTLSILDDCSGDDSYHSVLEAYGDLPNVCVQRNDRRLGQNATIDRLLQAVATPLFAVADHDDVWHPRKLEESVAELLRGDADLCYTDLEVVGADLEPIAPSVLRYCRMPLVVGRRPLPLLIKSPVHGCTVVGLRRLLDAALPIPEEVPHFDRWLALVAASEGGVACLDRPTAQYRQHGANSIGALPFSASGLRRRADAAVRRSVAGFARERLDHRLAYIEALDRRGRLDPTLAEIGHYLRLSRRLRIRGAPLYARLVTRRLPEVAWRVRLVDLALVLAAGGRRDPSPYRVLTLDEGGLAQECVRLAHAVEASGLRPTHVVAVADAGLEVARHLVPALSGAPETLAISARRPGTRLKRLAWVHASLARLPRRLTTWLRWVEHRLVEAGVTTTRREASMDPEALARLVDAADGARILVVDDCVDTGATLLACLELLRHNLPAGTEVRSAALGVSLPAPLAAPDVHLHRHTSIRGPWSIDG